MNFDPFPSFSFGIFRNYNVRIEFKRVKNVHFDILLEIIPTIKFVFPPSPFSFELFWRNKVEIEFTQLNDINFDTPLENWRNIEFWPLTPLPYHKKLSWNWTWEAQKLTKFNFDSFSSLPISLEDENYFKNEFSPSKNFQWTNSSQPQACEAQYWKFFASESQLFASTYLTFEINGMGFLILRYFKHTIQE